MSERRPSPHRWHSSAAAVGLRGALAGVLGGTVVAWFTRGTMPWIDIAGLALMVLLCGIFSAVIALVVTVVAARVKKRWQRLALSVILGLPALWTFADLQYSLLIKRNYANWGAGIERDADGVRSGCREFTVGNGASAVLLIHGFADSPAVYRRMAPALAEKGFTCYAMRLPGFAMPMAEHQRATAAEWREAVYSQLEAVRKRHGKVIVVGHSLGGAVAVDCLLDHREAADGLALLAPLLAVSDRRSPLLSPQAWFQILDHTLIFTDRVGMAFPQDLHDRDSLPFMKEDQFVPRALYRQVFAVIERNQTRTNTLSVPLLVVLAEDDPIVDNAAAERFFQESAAKTKRLRYAEGTGHILPLDYGWETLTADIAQLAEESGTEK